LIDVLNVWFAGFRNVIASYGVNGLTDDHPAALKRYQIRRVFIAYDGDEAGEKAARSVTDETLGAAAGKTTWGVAKAFPSAVVAELATAGTTCARWQRCECRPSLASRRMGGRTNAGKLRIANPSMRRLKSLTGKKPLCRRGEVSGTR
jgi:hypothetical protein